jgi:hypothetical protein
MANVGEARSRVLGGAQIWWGEAPERSDRCSEVSGDPQSLAAIRPLNALSRGVSWATARRVEALLIGCPCFAV